MSFDRHLFLWHSSYELPWKCAQDYFCLFLPNSIPPALRQNFNPSLLAVRGFVTILEKYVKETFFFIPPSKFLVCASSLKGHCLHDSFQADQDRHRFSSLEAQVQREWKSVGVPSPLTQASSKAQGERELCSTRFFVNMHAWLGCF